MSVAACECDSFANRTRCRRETADSGDRKWEELVVDGAEVKKD